MSRSFYVYELWNPLTNEVFYVGKGTNYGKGYRRLAEHIKDTRYYKAGKFKQNYKYNTIAKIMDAGMLPTIKVVFESENEQLAIEEEKRRILDYGRKDIGTGILVNHTNGGEGMTGFRHSQEHIERLKNDNPGGKSVAKALIGICCHTFKATEYESCQQASVLLTGDSTSKGNIHFAAKTKKRTTLGRFWRFKLEYDPNENFATLNDYRTDNSNRASKEILQTDIDGNFVKAWKSASDVCRHYGVHVSTLQRHLKNHSQWNGYFWSKNG